jgi:hypothetical protein
VVMLAAFAPTALLAGTALVAGTSCPPPPTVALPASEPALRPGPTELVAGIYMQGGAYFAGCKQQPRGPYGGTLTARSARTGRIVATRTLTHSGRLFTLRLAPGRYTVTATDTGGLRTLPQKVTIPKHTTVRQDVFIDVP